MFWDLKLDRFISVHRSSFFPKQMLKLQPTEKVSEIKYCCNQVTGFMFIMKLCAKWDMIWVKGYLLCVGKNSFLIDHMLDLMKL